MFVDKAKICVRGGDGGAGCVSFHREKYRPKGGPDGGDGGDGGDVLLRADTSVASLSGFRKKIHWRASNGAHGMGDNKTGRSGEDLLIPVPPGTSVRDSDGVLLADLVNPGDAAVIARGGAGGRGNASFTSRTRRLPDFAEQGEYGEEVWVSLELRLLADAALVGFPNAGKSTLISRVSGAKPKIADYPFTTLTPHLGVVRLGDTEFVLADIPGLVEGASEGRGLGDQFLRHIERCRALVILLDLAGERPPLDQESVLLADLEAHHRDLIEMPRLVAANKVDAARDEFTRLSQIRPEILGISAATGENVNRLMGEVARLVEAARKAEPERKGYVLHRPEPRGFRVEFREGRWVVSGRQAERVVSMADLTNIETLEYVRSKMRSMGVDDALEAAGVAEGDEIQIGPVTFEWEESVQAADSKVTGSVKRHARNRRQGAKRNRR